MKNGNILIVFILLVALSIIVTSFLFFIGGGLRGTTGTLNYVKALYIAEAGLNKAIWYFLTSPSQGGQGTTWKPSGFSESYGGGQYTFSIQNTADPLVLHIVSTGEIGNVQRGIEIYIVASSLPAVFDYALFNNGDLSLKGDTSLYGNVYSNGDIYIENPASVLDGEVTVPEGSSIGGDGTYTVGETPEDPPEMPAFDTSPYDNEIAFADSGDPLVLQGDQIFDNYDLGGNTIYVNGSVTVNGNLTGGGKIVSTGTVLIDDASVASDTTFISGGVLDITGATDIGEESLCYSSTLLKISGNPRVASTFLAPEMSLGGTTTIYGIIFSWGAGVDVVGTVDIFGSLCNPGSQVYTGTIALHYEPQYFPQELPAGMQAGDYDFQSGSWREL